MNNNSAIAPLSMPKAVNDGIRIPTLNNFGWMVTVNVDSADRFVEAAGGSPFWSLDIGCAYGVHTLAALKAGARVVALDLDERHLEILRGQVEPELAKNLKTACGAFPDVELPEESFGSILAARVLHFLDGDTLVRAATKMHELLIPGGKVFATVITAYTNITRTFIPVYEERKASGDTWPGLVTDSSVYMTDDLERSTMTNTQVHYFETNLLANIFENAGFVIECAEYVPIDLPWVRYDGRESILLIARKR